MEDLVVENSVFDKEHLAQQPLHGEVGHHEDGLAHAIIFRHLAKQLMTLEVQRPCWLINPRRISGEVMMARLTATHCFCLGFRKDYFQGSWVNTQFSTDMSCLIISLDRSARKDPVRGYCP